MTLRFADFELDEHPPQLTRSGERIPLPLTALRILALLVRARGRLVSANDLQLAIWPDRTVDFEASIHTAIRQIRRALGDDPAAPRFIATEPRRGYRFVGKLEEANPQQPAREGRSLKFLWVTTALLGLMIAAGIYLHATNAEPPPPPGPQAERQFSGTPDPNRAADRARRRAERKARAR